MVKLGGWLPLPSRHSPAIAMKGAPARVKRCFALGYFLPVNSKKAEAGTRQRLLLSKRRPSDRKLKAGPPRGFDDGKPKRLCASSIRFPASRITDSKPRFFISSAFTRTN